MNSLGKKILRMTGSALLVYLVYAVGFGLFSYLAPVKKPKTAEPENFLSHSTGPDRAMLVEAPQEAFARRVEIIRSAQETLDVTCHCVKAGETTDCIFGELIRAADRGVKVRVLLDGAIGGFTGSHKAIPLAIQAHPNMEFRGYNPIRLLKPWTWNARLHDKFILADDAMLMLGGRNIGDEYFAPPAYTGRVTHDRDVVVLNTAAGTPSGSAAGQVRAYMEELWSAPETQKNGPLTGRKLERGMAEQQRLRAVCANWEGKWPDYYTPAIPASELTVPTRKVSLVHNPLGDFKKSPTLGAELGRLLSTCRHITIQTPYATANTSLLKALTVIADGAEADLLTNSRASTPNLPAFSAYYAQREKFLDTGMTIHEYQSTDSIHGKSCVADGHLAVVGSYNLDDRSIFIDTESVLVIDSPEFYPILAGQLEGLMAQSAVVGRDNTYLSGIGPEPVEVPHLKQALITVVSVFSRAFQFLV